MVGLDVPPVGVSELLGALFGVLVGQLLTVLWDRAKRKAERRERRRVTERSIAGELRDIARDLERLDDDPETEPEFPYPTAAYQSSVASGRFANLDEDDQLQVARVYERLSQAEEAQERLQRARLRDADDRAYRRRLRIRVNDHIEALQEEIPTAVRELGDDSEPESYLATARRRTVGLLGGFDRNP